MRIIACLLFLIISMQSYAQQQLVVGVLSFNAPFSTEANTKDMFYGFDISIIEEICKRLNATCQYERKTFTGLFTAISNNEIDMAIGSLLITPERQKNYLFSMPYLIGQGSFLVRDKTITQVSQLENKRVAALSGTLYVNLISKELGPDVQVMSYPIIPDLLSNLAIGEVDAILIDKLAAMYWAAKDDDLSVIGQPINTGTGYGIMTNPANGELIVQINKILMEMEEDGTYTEIYESYFND